MSQPIRYCTMRQIHSNLYSCSAKLLWVFKLTVMFSNWNINLFKPLIWSPQWCITKYFIVSDLFKFYNRLLLFCTFLQLMLRVRPAAPASWWPPRLLPRAGKGVLHVSGGWQQTSFFRSLLSWESYQPTVGGLRGQILV